MTGALVDGEIETGRTVGAVLLGGVVVVEVGYFEGFAICTDDPRIVLPGEIDVAIEGEITSGCSL